jgi:hypothetical protein
MVMSDDNLSDFMSQIDPNGRMLLKNVITLDTLDTKKGNKWNFSGQHRNLKIKVVLEQDGSDELTELGKEILKKECLIWIQYIPEDVMNVYKQIFAEQQELWEDEQRRIKEEAKAAAKAQREAEAAELKAQEERIKAEETKKKTKLMDNFVSTVPKAPETQTLAELPPAKPLSESPYEEDDDSTDETFLEDAEPEKPKKKASKDAKFVK